VTKWEKNPKLDLFQPECQCKEKKKARPKPTTTPLLESATEDVGRSRGFQLTEGPAFDKYAENLIVRLERIVHIRCCVIPPITAGGAPSVVRVRRLFSSRAVALTEMSNENTIYLQLVRNCDNLMKNPKLSLYEEVERLKREAHKARTNAALLKKLRTDLSFLSDRLSSTEKVNYLRCCENEKEIGIWDSTEP